MFVILHESLPREKSAVIFVNSQPVFCLAVFVTVGHQVTLGASLEILLGI